MGLSLSDQQGTRGGGGGLIREESLLERGRGLNREVTWQRGGLVEIGTH